MSESTADTSERHEYGLVLFIGTTGSGRSTLARHICARADCFQRLSMLEPAIESLCAVLRDDPSNYTDSDKKRSLAAQLAEGDKTYQELLSDHYMAVRLGHTEWVFAANLQARMDAIRAERSGDKLPIFVVDDVSFGEEIQWLAGFKKCKLIIVRCNGDPAKLAARSGNYVDDLMNTDCERVESVDVEVMTEVQSSEECAAFVHKKIMKFFA